MSRDTNKALSEITDEGLFEAVATAVLREAHPLCASLVHPGVNAEGKTRKAPVDAFTIISDNGTPHLVAVQHTITAAESLERKWLFDPSSSIPRKARKTGQPAGDLVKTGSIVDAERSRTPQLLATLILTTNRPPPRQRAPARRCAARPRADPRPHYGRRLSGQRPQRQRQADRRPPVVAPRLDPARHHHDYRPAGSAQVALARDDRHRGRRVDLGRPEYLAVALAMAVHAQRSPYRPARTVAPRASPGPGLLRRWRSQQPILDVERPVNDE